MISKNELKYYSSLLKKKFREIENKFIAEGEKIVEEGLKSKFICEKVFLTKEFYDNKLSYLDNPGINKNILEILGAQEFTKISDTINSQGIAAVFQIPNNEINPDKINSSIIVCMDNISDPGNVGTILRNCDWFGVNEIILTKGSVEVYNPKTIRASMGSIFHLKIYREMESSFLSKLKENGYKILVTDIKGENINSFVFPGKAVIIFSNESLGPSGEVMEISDDLITIPGYGMAESLNVASASAVILNRVRK